ncbi:hypothetical protein PYCCODRAFT_1336640, partial [Trametes coccinea BRFM310]
MIRTAKTTGITVPGLSDAIRAMLFADDTTTYLNEHDDFQLIQTALDKWCSASKAKFNITKTEIIPIGTPEFRRNMVEEYKSTGRWKNLPQGARIAEDGEPTRLLGAFVGNNVDCEKIWEPKVRKIADTLERWSLHHTTIAGKKHAVQLVVGNLTQFLADVQSLPKLPMKNIEKAVRRYIWGETKTPTVSMAQLY